jgi:hypothetical protein
VRDAYLQRRRNLIYDGNPPREPDDEGDAAAPAKPGKDDAKPKAAPRTKQPRSYTVTRDHHAPIQSVLVSGEPLTPAEQAQAESLQRAQPIDRDVRASAATPLTDTAAAVAR